MISNQLYDNDNEMFVFGLILRGKVKRENLIFSISCVHPRWKIWVEGYPVLPCYPTTKSTFCKNAEHKNKNYIFRSFGKY